MKIYVRSAVITPMILGGFFQQEFKVLEVSFEPLAAYDTPLGVNVLMGLRSERIDVFEVEPPGKEIDNDDVQQQR